MTTIKSFFSGLFLLAATLAFSQDFEIYVSDISNFNPPWQILKYDQNGGNPEVFAPQSENISWPQDIVFLEDQGVALVSNFNTGRITKHQLTNGNYIENFATGLRSPTRMKIGKDSLLYILQWSGNAKVLRYKLNGTFVDEFTNMGVIQSIGIDWDEEDSVYISSFSGAHVRKFDSSGNDLGFFINSNLVGAY